MQFRLLAFFSLFILICFSPILGKSAESDGDSLTRAYRSELSKAFLNLKDGAIPVYRSNYRIGDVWDAQMRRLLESGSTCFRQLQIRSAPDSIPSIAFSHGAALGFLLRLKTLFDSAFKGAETRKVLVDFEDVREETVVEGDLRRAYDRTACPSLAPIIAGEKLAGSADIPVVIGRLYRGKRRIIIDFEDSAEAELKLKQVSRLVEAKSEVSVDTGRRLVVIDKESIPLAFAPAFVPVSVSSGPQGASATSKASYVWSVYDPKTFPSHRAVLPELGEAVEDGWSWEDR
jgi:hypothetical protein